MSKYSVNDFELLKIATVPYLAESVVARNKAVERLVEQYGLCSPVWRVNAV